MNRNADDSDVRMQNLKQEPAVVLEQETSSIRGELMRDRGLERVTCSIMGAGVHLPRLQRPLGCHSPIVVSNTEALVSQLEFDPHTNK